MKYVAIFHANLNYAYLTPDKYEFVIRNSYELIFDTMRDCFPNTKYVFEASGYTIEQMEHLTPDVLEKLKDAVARGQCEFMGSPYAHPMLPNFPKEDGMRSIKFSNDAYITHLGFKPKSFWNPECGWADYVPEQVIQNGYKNLIGDFESYSRSTGVDGTPQYPEIYKNEQSDDPSFYSFDFNYDLPGNENTIHFPFSNLKGADGKLRMFLRTDRVAQFAVRFFMGMEGYTFDAYMELIKKYSRQNEGEAEGALIIFADDAEYIGTNGWFKLKYLNQPDNVFEKTPASREKLIQVISACERLGAFVTYDYACQALPAIEKEITFDNDMAWHGARASTWASTPMARLLRPWQDLVRERLHTMEASPDIREKAWYHLTNSYNSDGQWPPTVESAPHIIHPFNYGYCFDQLMAAEMMVGGVDHSRLSSDPVVVLQEILSIQQKLVMEKAGDMMSNGTPEEKKRGAYAASLIEISKNAESVKASGSKVLNPSDYTIRANALIEARRMVGGVVLEKN